MRFVFSVVLALSVGIGAYFGSARAASSAKARPRMVLLRMGQIAAVGHAGPRAQCLATSESRSDPYRYAWLRCSAGPLSRATYWISLTSGGFSVFKTGVDNPVFTAENG
jgi:hypothetical protein